MESIGIDEARKDLGGVVDRVHHKDDAALIKRAGKPWAVMLSYDTALAVLGIASTVVGGGEYARLRRELREAANGVSSDRPDAPRVPQGEGSGTLCQLTEPPGHFHGK